MNLKESINLRDDVKAWFPDLKILVHWIEGVTIKKVDGRLESLKDRIIKETRGLYNVEELKDEPTLRAYRNFFWKIKVDPTKNRPASEALIRKIASGNPLPRINTLVDAYNLASIRTEIAIAAFDVDRLRGKLLMRFAEEGEEFLGIGMDNPLVLGGVETVIQDEDKLIAIYPYRDADESKVTLATRRVLLLYCGVPGIDYDKLIDAREVSTTYIIEFCGGTSVYK